jgi:Uma2 family endonuclease
MAKVATSPITVHDYREMPEGPPYFQLIEGDLFMSPSPNRFHQHILGSLHLLIGPFVRKEKLGEFHVAPSDVVLSETNVFHPDLYFVSRARRSVLTEQGVEGAPDLVVEILSPGTARNDKGAKRKVYSRTGVGELWLVDPDASEITVYRFEESPDEPVAVLGRRQTLKTPLLPGLKIRVADVFRR